MLVLSRRKGELVLVGAMQVKVLEIRGNKVVLGFSGDNDVTVKRGELADQPQTERYAEAVA